MVSLRSWPCCDIIVMHRVQPPPLCLHSDVDQARHTLQGVFRQAITQIVCLQALKRFRDRYISYPVIIREQIGMQRLCLLISMVVIPDNATTVPVIARQNAMATILSGLLHDLPFYLTSHNVGEEACQALHGCLTPCLACPQVRFEQLLSDCILKWHLCTRHC